jgi:GAF domain-containing protein
MEDRMSRAELWNAGADERERLADEREVLADEREALADEREAVADRQDHASDRRETDQARMLSGEVNEEAEATATQAAVRRAEAALRRAEAELLRARRATVRVAARASRRVAAGERAVAVERGKQADGAEERVWMADRRDFVAVERDHLAEERDKIADRRDEIAEEREHLADDRERAALDREGRLDQRRRTRHPVSAAASDNERRLENEDRRARAQDLRERATAARRAAADDHARAVAAWGPQEYGPMLVASFAHVARQLFTFDDLRDVLSQVLKFAVSAVAGCDWASVTLWRHERVIDTVTTNAVAAELDDIQFGTGIGPGPEALDSEAAIYASRLADSSRWPVLADTAAQLGVASALCHGLSVQQPAQWSPLGVLTLYSATPDVFTDEDQEFVSILAAYLSVAVAMSHRRDEVDRREAALHRGLSTRDVIGQAKGILMERQRLSAGDAFDLLRRASQQLNRKLADVAQHLAETGELPT